MAAMREPLNATATSSAHTVQHSPVPYLFGGLAAMLGLIAFALLIVACSYWKLSGYLEGGDASSEGEPDIEAGEGKGDVTGKGLPSVFEEKILVIMAGDVKPTFLATPMSSRSSFGDGKSSSDEQGSEKSEKSVEMVEKVEGGDLERTGNTETSESSHQNH